jgi:hypothetical protein
VSQNAAFRLHTILGVSESRHGGIAMRCMEIRESSNLAPLLRMWSPGGMCRSSAAGDRSRRQPSGWRPVDIGMAMKKTASQISSSEPIGIVISTGVRIPVEPLVRAYVWGPAPEEPSATEGTRAA